MISFPMIQIRQQFAKLGIDADHAQMEIRQPKATYEMRRIPPRLEIKQPSGELAIDQTRAWDALGRGPVLETLNRIYDAAYGIYLDGLARVAENGDKLAAIHEKTDAIAEIAVQLFFKFPEFNFLGPASVDNVDISYTARRPEINVIEGRIDVNTHPNRPEIEARRGKLEIYMLQYPKVEIIPPQIDILI